MNNSPIKQSNYSKLVVIPMWLITIGIIGLYCFYILPRKGFDFTDEGFILYSSWAAVTKNVPLDLISYLLPGVDLNGLLMLVGIHHYYSIRIAMPIFTVLTIIIFVTGVNHKSWASTSLITAVLIGVSAPTTSLLGYHNTPTLFLILSLGMFFRSISARSPCMRKISFLIAATALAISSMVNFSMLSASFLILIGLTFAYRKTPDITYFFFGFATLLTALIVSYISAVSPQAIFHLISQYKGKYQYTDLGNIQRILNSFSPYFYSACSLLLGTTSLEIMHKKTQLYTHQFNTIFDLLLNKRVVVIIALAPLIYYYLHQLNFSQPSKTILFYCHMMLAISIFSTIMFYRDNTIGNRIALSAIALFIYYLFQATFSSNHFINSFSHYIIGFGAIIASNYANSQITQKPENSTNIIIHNTINTLWIILLVTLSLVGFQINAHYAYRSFSPLTKKIKIKNGLLKGLWENSNKIAVINTLTNIYSKNNCSSKTFMTFFRQPLLYYLFQRKAPLGQSWHPGEFHFAEDQTQLINMLNKKHHWCVFTTAIGNYQTTWQHHGKKLYAYLSTNSKTKIIYITPKDKIHSPGFKYPKKYEIFIN